MDSIIVYGILRKGLFCLILLFTLSCTDNEDDSQNELETVLFKYHLTNSQSKDLKNGIDILISKDLNLKHKGLFYKINNSNKFYLAFIDNYENIIKVTKLRDMETVSLFDNNQCFVLYNKVEKSIIPQEEEVCFSFFIGEIPFEGYSNIELDWNCSNSSIITEKLIEGKYFFFFKESLGDNICNIKLISKDGKKEDISYNLENSSFIKKIE